MLEQWPVILAQVDDDGDVGKIIFGVIAALIWAVSAFVSWANKKTQEAKRRAQEEMMRRAAAQQSPSSRPPPLPQARQRIAEGIAARYPEVLRPPMQQQQRPHVRQGPPLPVQPMRPPPLPPKPKRRAKPVKAPMPPPMPVARVQEQLESAIVLDETPVSRRETHQRTSALAQMLTPRSLRNQFVLLEILQPPLALRDERRL